MKRIILSVTGLACICTSQAQTNDTGRIFGIRLDEFVFSASKFRENKKNISQPLQVISRKEIEWSSPQTSANLLEQTGNIFVQRSQMGGGSPVLRGFEASRVLLVVDGVHMNNAIYRAGHLQNVITLDNNIVDRVEVLYGPSSTIYGSDALGGVVVFNTKMPLLSHTYKLRTEGNAMVRYSSAYDEKTGHADFSIGGGRLGSLTSITYSKFGDLRQGAFRNPYNETFGSRDYYYERAGNADSLIRNNDPNVQKFSGYSQVDLLEKILFRQSEKVQHVLNLQYSTSSDIPRYDRLTDRRNGSLRWAEWYYGPQDRFLTSYQLNVKNAGFFNELRALVSYQAIEESRHQRAANDNDRESRIENVDVFGFTVDGRRIRKRHELTVGLDGQYNNVRSKAFTENIVTGTNGRLDTRYPDGGSNMFYGALYAQHLFHIKRDRLILNDGVRLNFVSLRSVFNDTTFFPFPFNEATQRHTAWSGNLGLVYLPVKRLRTALNLSTGFRSPNVDDMTKVFESAGGTQLVVPNPDLKPEYTYNADLSLSYTANNVLRVDFNAFYTIFDNAIVLDRFTLNGRETVMYGGAQTAVVAPQNKAVAYVHGFSGGITAHLVPHVTLYSTLSYTYGRYHDQFGNEAPLDHIPPVFGKTSVMYQQGKFTGEFFALYNGWKLLKDYNPFGEDNLQYATPQGMPAWYTLNLRAGMNVNRHFAIQAALENILDYNYRVFASGIQAPGRNMVITLRGRL